MDKILLPEDSVVSPSASWLTTVEMFPEEVIMLGLVVELLVNVLFKGNWGCDGKMTWGSYIRDWSALIHIRPFGVELGRSQFQFRLGIGKDWNGYLNNLKGVIVHNYSN